MQTILDLGVLMVNILMMMAIGLDLAPRHFKAMSRQKKPLVLSLAAQFVLLPLLGLALTRVITLPSHVSAGILLLVACPNGDIVNYYTWLARTNVALAVTMTIIALLLSVLTMPIVFGIYARVFESPFAFAVPPLRLILRLTLMVALPIAAGMAMRHFRPDFPGKYRTSLRNASLLGVAFLILFIMINQAERLSAEWQQIAFASAVLILASLLLGFGMSVLARLNASDTFTIGAAFAARNVSLAMVIAITLLNRIEFATFATVYFMTELPLLVGAVVIYRRIFNAETSSAQFEMRKAKSKLES